tara:strand:- start:604 stop:708 length:105 start_codon:yes stop_codon:yes gene_type:complete
MKKTKATKAALPQENASAMAGCQRDHFRLAKGLV